MCENMLDLRVVAFCGPICSGKSLLSSSLAQNTKYERLRSKLYIEAFLNSNNVELTEPNMQHAGKFLVSTLGGAGLTKRVLSMRNSDTVIYDSFRNLDEAKHFKLKLGKRLQLIYLDIPEVTRKQRYLNREGRDNSETSFYTRMKHSVEVEVNEMQEYSDLVIELGPLNLQIQNIVNHLNMQWGNIR